MKILSSLMFHLSLWIVIRTQCSADVFYQHEKGLYRCITYATVWFHAPHPPLIYFPSRSFAVTLWMEPTSCHVLMCTLNFGWNIESKFKLNISEWWHKSKKSWNEPNYTSLPAILAQVVYLWMSYKIQNTISLFRLDIQMSIQELGKKSGPSSPPSLQCEHRTQV